MEPVNAGPRANTRARNSGGATGVGTMVNVAASLSKGDRVLVKGRLDFRKYQNKDGVEVTTHDIIADEVAPSLKYATAQMTRIERSGGQGGQGGGNYQGGGGRQGGGGGNYQGGGGGRPADPVYGDEEPF